jgi:hypothetical protein
VTACTPSCNSCPLQHNCCSRVCLTRNNAVTHSCLLAGQPALVQTPAPLRLSSLQADSHCFSCTSQTLTLNTVLPAVQLNNPAALAHTATVTLLCPHLLSSCCRAACICCTQALATSCCLQDSSILTSLHCQGLPGCRRSTCSSKKWCCRQARQHQQKEQAQQ